MKKIALVSIATAMTAMTASFTPVTHAGNFGEMMCKYVQDNDKSRIRTLLRSSNIRIRNIFDDLRCNGENILDFSITSNSPDAGKFIISKLPKSDVREQLASIEQSGNAEIILAAQERVSG